MRVGKFDRSDFSHEISAVIAKVLARRTLQAQPTAHYKLLKGGYLSIANITCLSTSNREQFQ